MRVRRPRCRLGALGARRVLSAVSVRRRRVRGCSVDTLRRRRLGSYPLTRRIDSIRLLMLGVLMGVLMGMLMGDVRGDGVVPVSKIGKSNLSAQIGRSSRAPQCPK